MTAVVTWRANSRTFRRSGMVVSYTNIRAFEVIKLEVNGTGEEVKYERFQTEFWLDGGGRHVKIHLTRGKTTFRL